MPADSLVDMARRACMKSYRGINNIGDVPYELLRPVLLKIENPEQLHILEQNSPQIIGKDREIWLSMIKRDIPDYETKPHEPSDPKNWWKVYRKLKQEAQREMAAGDEKLKAALNVAQTRKNVPTTKIIPQNQLPRQAGVRRRQAITYDYISGRTGSKGAHKMSIMDKIRKETRGTSSARMSRPTHELQKRSSGVSKAPQSFVRDIRQQNLAKVPLAEAREAMGYTQVRRPRQSVHPAGSYDVIQDREKRLRSLKAGKQVEAQTTAESKVNHLTLDFLEDEEDDDELFGVASGSRSNANKGNDTSRLGISSPQTMPQKSREQPRLFMAGQKRKRPSPEAM